MSRTLPFLCALTLPVIDFQQFEDVGLNSGSIVAFGEILLQIRGAETDLLLLVGFGFSENVEDFIHIQIPGLAQLLQPDGLREGGGAVLAFNGFQQVRLFLFGQVGQLYCRGQGNFATVYHGQNSGD